MKKYLLIFALILPFVVTACSDDDEDLDGTVWEAVWLEDGETNTMTLSFEKNTFELINVCVFDFNGDGQIDDSETKIEKGSGTYTYKDPVVTLYANGQSGKATISGNKLTTEEDEFSDYLVFTKK